MKIKSFSRAMALATAGVVLALGFQNCALPLSFSTLSTGATSKTGGSDGGFDGKTYAHGTCNQGLPSERIKFSDDGSAVYMVRQTCQDIVPTAIALTAIESPAHDASSFTYQGDLYKLETDNGAPASWSITGASNSGGSGPRIIVRLGAGAGARVYDPSIGDIAGGTAIMASADAAANFEGVTQTVTALSGSSLVSLSPSSISVQGMNFAGGLMTLSPLCISNLLLSANQNGQPYPVSSTTAILGAYAGTGLATPPAGATQPSSTTTMVDSQFLVAQGSAISAINISTPGGFGACSSPSAYSTTLMNDSGAPFAIPSGQRFMSFGTYASSASPVLGTQGGVTNAQFLVLIPNASPDDSATLALQFVNSYGQVATSRKMTLITDSTGLGILQLSQQDSVVAAGDFAGDGYFEAIIDGPSGVRILEITDRVMLTARLRPLPNLTHLVH